jgi:hypothetical protein
MLAQFIHFQIYLVPARTVASVATFFS